jgi:hypothetical protein
MDKESAVVVRNSESDLHDLRQVRDILHLLMKRLTLGFGLLSTVHPLPGARDRPALIATLGTWQQGLNSLYSDTVTMQIPESIPRDLKSNGASLQSSTVIVKSKVSLLDSFEFKVSLLL